MARWRQNCFRHWPAECETVRPISAANPVRANVNRLVIQVRLLSRCGIFGRMNINESPSHPGNTACFGEGRIIGFACCVCDQFMQANFYVALSPVGRIDRFGACTAKLISPSTTAAIIGKFEALCESRLVRLPSAGVRSQAAISADDSCWIGQDEKNSEFARYSDAPACGTLTHCIVACPDGSRASALLNAGSFSLTRRRRFEDYTMQDVGVRASHVDPPERGPPVGRRIDADSLTTRH